MSAFCLPCHIQGQQDIFQMCSEFCKIDWQHYILMGQQVPIFTFIFLKKYQMLHLTP